MGHFLVPSIVYECAKLANERGTKSFLKGRGRTPQNPLVSALHDGGIHSGLLLEIVYKYSRIYFISPRTTFAIT
jgi:hypothetical protein